MGDSLAAAVTTNPAGCSAAREIRYANSNLMLYADGGLAFSEEGYARWKPRLAKIGIAIDTITTGEGWLTALQLEAEAQAQTDPAAALLAAALEDDPDLRAQRERHAERLVAATIREHGPRLRVVTTTESTVI